MAPILDFHNPLVVTFGLLGNIVSICVYLAPLPTFIQICREKSVLGFQALPYLVALFSSMLWLYYAFLKENAALLITINSFGCLIETIYIMIYLVYVSKNARKYTAKLFVGMNGLLFFAILLLTHFLLKGRIRVQIVGWVCVAVSVSVFAAPLSIVLQVVRTRSVKFMPFTLSVFLTLSAVMWFGYGLFEKDPCIWIPNVAGFILGMLQMGLYAAYRNAREILKEEKLPAEHIIVILGTPAVHPVHEKKTKSENDGIKNYEKENEQPVDDYNNNNQEKIVALPYELPNRATVQLDWVTHDAEKLNWATHDAEKTKSEIDGVKNHGKENEQLDDNNNQKKIVALSHELANRATVQLDSPVLVVCRA